MSDDDKGSNFRSQIIYTSPKPIYIFLRIPAPSSLPATSLPINLKPSESSQSTVQVLHGNFTNHCMSMLGGLTDSGEPISTTSSRVLAKNGQILLPCFLVTSSCPPSTVHDNCSSSIVQCSEIPDVQRPDLMTEQQGLSAVAGPDMFVPPNSGGPAETVPSMPSVASHELELWYQFVGLSATAAASSVNLVVSCDNISAFVKSFRFLSVKDTRTLAEGHGLGTRVSSRQNLHRDALRTHHCGASCPGLQLYMVFRKLTQKRRLNPNIPSLPPALEILYINEDGLPEPGAIRSFELNKYFQFLRCGPQDDLSRFSRRNYIICHTDAVSRFVSMYNALTVKHLRALAVCHNLPLLDHKKFLLGALMSHSCDSTCSSNYLLFKPLPKPRSGQFNVHPIPGRTTIKYCEQCIENCTSITRLRVTEEGMEIRCPHYQDDL
ncbi:hypothetical protein B0H16DRAFT_1707497 [Mycena metata]|uniref:Uncharacterized protein n=1 Tax=Mycena metata TaxID=1033252 RepID=A0AAD7GEQ8_9AGAR|nr:hypothetical protein B0H16DRAFT_1707497 [Mycena metata]